MMKQLKYILFSLMSVAVVNTTAQKICDFEADSYQAIGTYDYWKQSPFNTGQLTGNMEVVENTIKSEKNETDHILAIQRSRYGSNLFGAKIRLKEPFELTPTTKYIHVLMHTPVKSRVMLLGLGKRQERKGQSDQVIQFEVVANNDIKENEWSDAVFSVKGNTGVVISSLVVVPDCESPHNLQEDFIAYVDEIEMSDDLVPRFDKQVYWVNFDKKGTLNRDDRHLDRVRFSGNSEGNLDVAVPTVTDKLVYHDLTDKVGFAVKGEEITPRMSYKGFWMHGYVYVDWNDDGKFKPNVDENTGKPTDNSELLSFSYYKGKNSLGQTLPNGNPGVNSSAFTVPENIDYGIYRMRYKVDWDNIDAGGSIDNSNHIINNGGAIVDVLLNVHKSTSHVKVVTRNGDVLKVDGAAFEESDVPFSQAVEIELKPEQNFKQNGVIVKHGYLDKPEFVNGNRQWRIDTIPPSKFVNDKATIPAEMFDGDVIITAEFASKTGVDEKNEDKDIVLTTTQNYLCITTTVKNKIITINDTLGHIYFSGVVNGKKSFNLNTGIYFVNRMKIFVP